MNTRFPREHGTKWAPLWFVALALWWPSFSPAFADDVGDTLETAEWLQTGSVVRVINSRADRDVFVWTAYPYVTNWITVGTGTLLDVEADWFSPSGLQVLLYTNTAAGTPLMISVYSTTVARRCYLAIGSLAEFSTGTYHITFGRSFTDLDGDGLPDAWELSYAPSLTNLTYNGDPDGDNIPNYAEWVAGTHPGDAASCLRMTHLQIATNAVHLTWTSVPEGLYRISGAPSITGEWATLLDNVLATNSLTTRDAGSALSNGMYRVTIIF